MSMLLSLVAVSDANIARLLADPPLVYKVISPDDDTWYEEARNETPLGKEKEVAPLEFGEGELAETNLDKAWHGVHYVLTGTAWEGEPPLNFLLLGGQPVGDLDVGYGPARAIRSGDLRGIEQALSQTTDDQLQARLNWEDMQKQKIYPGIWDRDPVDEQLVGYVMDSIGELRYFLQSTVQNGLGAVIYLV